MATLVNLEARNEQHINYKWSSQDVWYSFAIYIANNLYGELKWLSYTAVEPESSTLHDLHQGRFIDYDLCTHKMNLIILDTWSQTLNDDQTSSSSSDDSKFNTETKPTNPFNVFSDTYAGYLSRGPDNIQFHEVKTEDDDKKPGITYLQVSTLSAEGKTVIIDPNSVIQGHGRSIWSLDGEGLRYGLDWVVPRASP